MSRFHRYVMRLTFAALVLLADAGAHAAHPLPPGRWRVGVKHHVKEDGWLHFAAFLALVGVSIGAARMGRAIGRTTRNWKGAVLAGLAGASCGAVVAALLYWLFEVTEYPLAGVVAVFALFSAIAGVRSARETATAHIDESSRQDPSAPG